MKELVKKGIGSGMTWTDQGMDIDCAFWEI